MGLGINILNREVLETLGLQAIPNILLSCPTHFTSYRSTYIPHTLHNSTLKGLQPLWELKIS